MKASDALKTATKSARDSARAERIKAKKEEHERLAAEREAIRKDFPKRLKDIRAMIRATAKAGRYELPDRYTMSSENVAGKQIIQKLVKTLKQDGYNAWYEEDFINGEYDNMGDFNAPCNVWRDSRWIYTLHVSWETVIKPSKTKKVKSSSGSEQSTVHTLLDRR